VQATRGSLAGSSSRRCRLGMGREKARSQSRYQAVGSARGKGSAPLPVSLNAFSFSRVYCAVANGLEPTSTELHVMAGAQRGGEHVALVAVDIVLLVDRVGAAGVVLVAAGGERGVHVQPPVEPAG